MKQFQHTRATQRQCLCLRFSRFRPGQTGKPDARSGRRNRHLPDSEDRCQHRYLWGSQDILVSANVSEPAMLPAGVF
jgi:hypothetical protein